MTPRSPHSADLSSADLNNADVVIAGAGIVGASVAYWLTRFDPSVSVLLVERDRSFAQASSSLSASSIRQQFSHPLNIRMSRFGLAFLHEMGIAVDEKGYLYLGAAAPLRALNEVQRANGADIALIAPAALSARFPWLNVADIELGIAPTGRSNRARSSRSDLNAGRGGG